MTVIVISGQPGAGSTTVGKLIAEKFDLNYFSPGRVFKDLAHGKIKEKNYFPLFKELCDKNNLVIPNFSFSFISDSQAANDFWDTEFGKSKELHNVIEDLQKSLAEKGNLVLDGKLSLRMIENADLKIWLKADLSERAKRTAKRDSLEFENAKKILLERQEKERKDWKKIYRFDYWNQEKEADLVVDTSNKTPEQVAEKIVGVL